MSDAAPVSYPRKVSRFSRNARLWLISQVLAGLGLGVYNLLFNLYLVNLGFNEEFIGLNAGLSTLTTGLLAFPAGLLADRIGRRFSLLIGAIVSVVGFTMPLVMYQPAAILFWNMLGGAGVSLIAVSQNPLLAENSTPQERTSLFAVSAALMTFAGMIGSLAGGILVRSFSAAFRAPAGAHLPYQLALWISMFLLAVSAIPIYLLSADRHLEVRHEPPPEDVDMDRPAVYRRMVGFAAVNILVGIGGGLILPFFNVFFVKQHAMSTATVGLIFAAGQAVIGVSSFVGPAVARRLGKVRTVALGHGLSPLFLMTLALTNSAPLATLAYWARAAGANGISPVHAAFSMEIVPARLRGTLSGISSTAWNLAWAVSSTVGGALILSLGYQGVFAIAAVFYALTGMLYYVWFRRYQRL